MLTCFAMAIVAIAHVMTGRLTGRAPDFTHENRLKRRYGGLVAGVDEAGRGPLAGPVVAAAVILDPRKTPNGIYDSKMLTRAERERLAEAIMDSATVAVSVVSVATIDAINILQASLLAMSEAVSTLSVRPSAALVDGRERPGMDCAAETLIDADALSLSVAAASIVAKVTRDRIMMELAAAHDGYGWRSNMGYATVEHRLALHRLGPTQHHRRTFAPVKCLLVKTG